jgi:TolB-like protein/tetratricopeptide (TPR) repeat protein
MSLVAELRRRNVFRVAAAYLVVGWLLTEVLTTILPTLGAPEWAARAVILIFAFGFIPAVVLSWFYEITADGIKRDQDVDRELPGTNRAARKIDKVTIATAIALIVVVGLFSARYTADDPSSVDLAADNASVAVLPFVNMSNDKDNEYFSDGLTETLLHMLAQIPDLRVAARTSSFAFKGRNLTVQEIARALDVAHVLEGSVQRDGDRVRITAQLIRASDGFHVWSEVYDRTLDDIFGIQDEIATIVGGSLSASLLGIEGDQKVAGIQTTNPDAYDLYLQARKERATYSYTGLQAAEDLLKGALLIDPAFLDAKTELATNYIHQLETGLMDRATGLSEIVAITDQVLNERPEDPVAKATSIYAKAVSLLAQGDQEAMPLLAGELESIVERYPDELHPRQLLVRAYRILQQPDKSVPILKSALDRDPFNPTLLYEIGRAYMPLERWGEARASLERSLEIEPSQPNAYSMLGALDLREGNGVGFVTQYMKAIAVDPRDHELPGILASILYQLDLIEEGDDFRNRVLALAPTSAIAYQIELQRARSIGDEVGSDAAARRAIEDDIEDRRFAYGAAIQHLVRTAVRDGRVDDELEWLVDKVPGFLDVESKQLPQKRRAVQGLAFDALIQTEPREEVVRRLEILLEFASSQGFNPEDDPLAHMNILVIRHEIEEAINVALKGVFTESVATNLDWQETFAQPQFAEVVADPRVQEAMQRWRSEEEALRGSVRSYFADLHAAT